MLVWLKNNRLCGDNLGINMTAWRPLLKRARKNLLSMAHFLATLLKNEPILNYQQL